VNVEWKIDGIRLSVLERYTMIIDNVNEGIKNK